MSFGLIFLMIWFSALLPILMFSLFFLFVFSFSSGSLSSMFMFYVLKNFSRISIVTSSITILFSITMVSFSSNRSSCSTGRFVLFFPFPCLTYSMMFCTCSGVRFSNLSLASSRFCRSVFMGCLIFVLIFSIFEAVNLFFYIISLLRLASLLTSI